MKKENVFIITLILFPFILSLLIFRLINFLKSNLYDYLIIVMSLVFLFYFIETLFFMLDDIIHSNNKKRIIFVMFIPFIYIPIYYYKNISRNDKYLSYFIFTINIILIVGLYFSFRKSLSNYVILKGMEDFVLKDTFDYSDKNNVFTIKIDKDYRCDNNLEGYVFACENNKNDAFIGVYSYEDANFNQGKLDDIMSFHFEDVLRVINENNYESSIEYLDNYVKINYSDMEVLLTQRNYFFPDKGYSLIIIMESSIKDSNINDLENIIETIQFLT